MAITRESDIFNNAQVNSACDKLDGVITQLNNAIGLLNNAKSYTGEKSFLTDEGNPFPYHIDATIDNINTMITDLRSLKTAIKEKAQSIHNSDRTSYNNYVAEQERIAREKAEREKAEREKAANNNQVQLMEV